MMSTDLHPVLSIRLFRDDKCFGSGVAQLLRLVQQHHSLRGAAIAMGMAYSKAWTVMRRCEEELGFPLLVYATGGKNGGGATVTPEAERLLTAYDRYCQRVQDLSETVFLEEFQEFL